METVHLAENLHTQNNQQFIETLNSLVPITDPFVIKIFKEEFSKRAFDFKNLILNPNEIRLQQPVRLVNNTLFETQIPLPHLVSPIYPKVYKLKQFITQIAAEYGKELVSYSYIIDQLLIPKNTVTILSETESQDPLESKIFIAFKIGEAFYPSIQEIKTKQIIVVEKGEKYRSLKAIYLLDNLKEIDRVEL